MAGFKAKAVFGGFSVDDLDRASKFYSDVLGFKIDKEDRHMGLTIHLPSGGGIFVYEKENHKPATFTILNLVVDDIDRAVDQLAEKGIEFEHYKSGMLKTDAKGIARGRARKIGPDIAWFKDPAGNFISVLQE